MRAIRNINWTVEIRWSSHTNSYNLGFAEDGPLGFRLDFSNQFSTIKGLANSWNAFAYINGIKNYTFANKTRHKIDIPSKPKMAHAPNIPSNWEHVVITDNNYIVEVHKSKQKTKGEHQYYAHVGNMNRSILLFGFNLLYFGKDYPKAKNAIKGWEHFAKQNKLDNYKVVNRTGERWN